MTKMPDGATRFRATVWWAVFVIMVSGALAVAGTYTGLNLLFGSSYWPDLDDVMEMALPLLCGLTSAVVGTRATQRRRWVTVSDAGIEISEHGVPILIEWANIASVTVRRWGLFAALEVVPAQLQSVRTVGPGTLAPVVRQMADGRGFRVEVGLFWPLPRALRAALARHTPHP